MADEDAELIGGIYATVGASHAGLPGDLAEADRILEAWAKQRFTVQIGATVQTPAAAPARAQQAPAIQYRGASLPTPAFGGRSQSEINAINAALAKTGERYNAQTGEIEAATQAAQRQKQVIVDVQQEAAKEVPLNIPTEALQADLKAVLGALEQIAAAAKLVSQTPLSVAPAASGGTRAPRGRSPRVYSFDPAQYEEQDRVAEARAARQREVAVSAHNRTMEAEARRTQAVQARVAAANSLNANPVRQAAYTSLPSRTNVNAPGYRSDEEEERERQRQQINLSPAQQAAQRELLSRTTAPTTLTAREQQTADRAIAQAQDARERAEQTQSLRQARLFARAQLRRSLQEATIQRQSDIAFAQREAELQTAGRTARTGASALGGFNLGPGRERLRLEKELREAENNLRSATTYRATFDREAIDIQIRGNQIGGEAAKIAERKAEAIRRLPDYRKATDEETAALERQKKAQADLERFNRNPLNAARNLLAITGAGLAFGAALKVVDVALGAVTPALGDFIDQATGFGAVSNRITQGLAQQTSAAYGNVKAVLATAEAQAGLSASASDAINAQIQLTTQIKAGAAAAAQQGGLFRAAIGAGQGAPQGLLGGYGGLFGGPLFAQQLGGGAGFAETIKSTFGDITQALNAGVVRAGNANIVNPFASGVINPLNIFSGQGPSTVTDQQNQERITKLAGEREAYEANLNDAARRGAVALGSAGGAIAQFGQITDAQVQQIQDSGLPQELKDLASQSHEALLANGQLVTSTKQANDALQQFAAGLSIPDLKTYSRIAFAQEQQRQQFSAASLDTIRAQQAFARPAQIRALQRQTSYQLTTQLPVQQALAGLANPNVSVESTIPGGARSAAATANIKEANNLQAQLNTRYQQGQQIIRDTYDPAILANFGQAAQADFDQALQSVVAVGQQIASTQAAINKEQLAYQVAQYNFQLQIAKRTLSDIGGLTDHNFGAGESYLGTLERQNLLLSRQGQILQFNLAQRQINFQVALAGFQAPGVTPEERQANIKEAQIEASYAQKQLDIQKQMFGNQVKIVDISNLRQGYDLARQIALLTQGRRVASDTAAAEAKLIRLQQIQQQNVAKVSSYLNAVDNLAAQASGEIAQLETAAGRALTRAGEQAIYTVYGFYKNLTKMFTSNLNQLGGQSGGLPPDERGTTSGVHASGYVGLTNGPTMTGVGWMGEAGTEAYAILRNPKALSSGTGGGTTIMVDVHDNSIRSENDIDTLTRKIIAELGRKASILGLRGIG